jgi:hypothetical protein
LPRRHILWRPPAVAPASAARRILAPAAPRCWAAGSADSSALTCNQCGACKRSVCHHLPLSLQLAEPPEVARRGA